MLKAIASEQLSKRRLRSSLEMAVGMASTAVTGMVSVVWLDTVVVGGRVVDSDGVVVYWCWIHTCTHTYTPALL